MSFIIKGFDTDGNCLHCYFQSEDSDRCLLTDDDIPLYGKGHPESCPLIPLPEGHGRLIDADEFIERVRMDDRTTIIEEMHVAEILSEAPTIVPAEGGNADGD